MKLFVHGGKNVECLHFSKSEENLKIGEFKETDPLADSVSHKSLKAITKYKNHPSIIAFRSSNRVPHFHFCFVNLNDILKEIRKLSVSKAAQITNIPVKVLRQKLIFLRSAFVSFSVNP